MDYCGHPKHQNFLNSSSSAGSNISSDEYYQYLKPKDNHPLGRNDIKIRFELNNETKSSSVTRIALPLSVSSSTFTTKVVSYRKTRVPYCQKFKPLRDHETSPLDQHSMMRNRRLKQQNRISKSQDQEKRTKQENMCQQKYTPQLHAIITQP